MTPFLHALGQEVYKSYESYRYPGITSCRFTQAELLEWLTLFDGIGLYSKTPLGTSGEGRPISLYTIGNGPIKVMLWSQMHGDEPTATMALLDIFNFFRQNPDHFITKTLTEKVTLLVIPMLNPDGAQRFTRRTAQQIDMNRDALALATPEARILKEMRDTFQPEYGFNLHDQDPRMSVGTTKKIVAMALLAPATDESRCDNKVRFRAKKVASLLAQVVNQHIPGYLAKWDDSFEPRAFGDSIQKWGTSTVLIESGGWKGDPNKFFIRKLNCVGLLTTLSAVAIAQHEEADVAVYEQIPFNMKLGCDYLIRNAQWKVPGTPAIRIDVAINMDKRMNPHTGRVEDVATIIEMGDLHTFTALEEERDAVGFELDVSKVILERTFPASDIETILRRV